MFNGIDSTFWQGRRVLLTGHTGFKGAWAALWLNQMGARVSGISLAPETSPDLFDLANVSSVVDSHILDLAERDKLTELVARLDPEIVLHMAAQPLVRRSYVQPVETYLTNVMGTVHLLDALRTTSSLRTVLVVTTDKVYENAETGQSFREDDRLGGHDPYAASKAAAEIVTASYAKSFFNERGIRVATARGGNVIGGGDFSEDRLIPDIWRAAKAGTPLKLRSPNASRPWQHVLDCLTGYFAYVRALDERAKVPTALNFGPHPDAPSIRVAELAEAVQSTLGNGEAWQPDEAPAPHEMSALEIDSSLARACLGWEDRLPGYDCVQWLVDWYQALNAGEDMRTVSLAQLSAYQALKN
ncbi:MAG: CDP-glucose 4,6-dehydratase [Rhizobiales bacterium]|nr:CDP-glucose 4,6-dehydratase [Hyphomicrobiales bacterium]